MSATTSFLSDLSVIIASCAAIYGVLDWRRVFFAKRKAEFAEELLVQVYIIRDDLDYIRNKFVIGSEGDTREKMSNETNEEQIQKNVYYAHYERIIYYENDISNALAMRYRYKVMLGGDESTLESLRGIIKKVVISIFYLISSESDPRSVNSEEVENQKAVLYKNYGENNIIDKEIADAIESIEKTCAPYIGSVHPLWKKWVGWFSYIRKLKGKMGDLLSPRA